MRKVHVDTKVAIAMVFAFKVPKYSDETSVVSIDITPRGAGCEVRLTQTVSARWADQIKKFEAGWALILEHAATVID